MIPDDNTPLFTRMMAARRDAMQARNDEIAMLNEWLALPAYEKED